MDYRVLLETHARKEFLALPRAVQERLGLILDDLAKNPRPIGVKKLSAKEGYRTRKGDYRILYLIDDKEREVRIYRIGHRREVYR